MNLASLKLRAKSWSRIWHANIGMATAITLGAIAVSCPFIAHKGGDIAIGKALMKIHYGEFLPAQWKWLWIDSQGVALFFLIASGWFIHFRAVKKATTAAADDPTAPGSSVTLLADSAPALESARELGRRLEARGIRVHVALLSSYDPKRLSDERWLAVAIAEAEGASPLEDILKRTDSPRLARLGAFVLPAGRKPASPRVEAFAAALRKRHAAILGETSGAMPDDSSSLADHWETAILPALSKHIPAPRTASSKESAPQSSGC